MALNYQWPFSKIPLVNFLSLTTRYNANYDWNSAALSMQDFGNTIQNSNNIQHNGQINMNTLYNKVPYFKKVLNSNKRNNNRRTSRVRSEDNPKDNKKKDEVNLEPINLVKIS